MPTRYEWDAAKARTNWTKHKVDFEQARNAFRDPHALDDVDDKQDYGEDRFNLMGMVDGRLLVVSYAQTVDESTGDEIIRIISARKAERREAKRYHET